MFTIEGSKNVLEAPVHKSFWSVIKQKEFRAMRKIQKGKKIPKCPGT